MPVLISFQLSKLELLFFFAGYPLLYAIIIVAAGGKAPGNFFARLARLLPYSYALAGTLYLGLQLKNIHDGRTIGELDPVFQTPWLVMWALLSLLCWIPAIAKLKAASLLHSLVFLLLLLKDFFSDSTGDLPRSDLVHNDMVIYTLSFLFNTLCLFAIVILHFLFFRHRMSKFTPRS
jgi:hypothetical protein